MGQEKRKQVFVFGYIMVEGLFFISWAVLYLEIGSLEMIKLRWSHLGRPQPNITVLMKRGNLDTEAHTQGECYMKIKSEVKMRHHDCQQITWS